MAFGRQKADGPGPEDSSVPQDEALPILEAATRARDGGRRIFTCAVTVGFSTGSGVGLGGKKTTRVQRWDPAALIEGIESLGWRLEHMDHVWEQTEHNTALNMAVIRGLTVAHMQFRISAAM
ncbi:hypothetical protein ACI792_04415 [Blastococcus sp. SYSU DS0669]